MFHRCAPARHVLGGHNSRQTAAAPVALNLGHIRAAVGDVRLYLWQQEALRDWYAKGCRGVVEAVTGTGKTMVALAAAADVIERGGRVQILVPTIELLHQWTREVRKHLPGRIIGQLGDGSDASLRTRDVLVSVVNSARRYEARDLPETSLLIADECHRYGSSENAKALNPRFRARLGLGATYARQDDGNATIDRVPKRHSH